MELTKPEMAAVQVVDKAVTELTDLELVLVGGGVGEVILA